MTLTRKFSQFVPQNVTSVVGLAGGANSIGPNSGGGGSGAVTQVIIQANSFTPGQWVRFDEGTNLYVTALATTPQNAEVVGVVIAVAPPGGPPFTQFTLQQSGYITPAQAVFGILTPGQPQFLSDAVPGAMVNVDVIIDGEVSRPVFIPDNVVGLNTGGWVLPYRGIIVGGPDPGGGGGGTPGTNPNIVTVILNNHNFNAGDWLRVTNPAAGPQTGYTLALANTLANSQSVGVVIDVIDVNTFMLQFSGYVATAGTITAPFQDALFNPLTPATVYYLSSTNAGFITAVDPGLTGGISKPLFISEQTLATVNTDAGYILPQRPLTGFSVNPNASPWIFMGVLNAANNFSDANILIGPNGETYNAYKVIVNVGIFTIVEGIEATGPNPISIGFRVAVGGVFITTPSNYANYVSGVNSTAGINTATLWGNVSNSGIGPGRDFAQILPATSNRVSLIGGDAILTRNNNGGGVLTGNWMCFDKGTTPGNTIGYTSVGWCGGGVVGLGLLTGLQVHFGGIGAAIVPGSTAYISIYGIPNA